MVRSAAEGAPITIATSLRPRRSAVTTTLKPDEQI